MIPGVVLAAGRSERMGSPKAFLKWGESTFLQTIVDRLKEVGASGIYVVAGPDTVQRARDLVANGGVTVLLNEDADNEGPISSIRVALESLDAECWGFLACPVDHPSVERSTYATLLQEGRDNPGQIIVPVCQGKPGHPTLFPAEVFDDLRQVAKGRGADAVVEANAHRVVQVEVSDAGVLSDIDTPEDYESARAAEPGQ